MQASRFRGVAILAGVALVLGVAYRHQRHSPPYEQGMHDFVRAAELPSSAISGAPHIGDCPVFPADNIWNTPIDKLAKDPRSEAYIDSIGPLKKVHADFASKLNFGIPFTMVSSGTRPVQITFDYKDESDLGHYPIPPDAPIEGGDGSTGDRHVLVIDPRRCLLYEIFDAHKLGGNEWKAGSGIRMDLTDNALRADGKTSADAAGLPIFPGLVRYDEVAAGEINHALRFTVPHTQNAYIWPARHKASKDSDSRLPPLGVRFRLRADFDISKYSKANQVILTALKRYGMILADNGSAVFISGVPDKRWNDDDLHKLGVIEADDFEAVDESQLQLLPDSGRVDPVSVKR